MHTPPPAIKKRARELAGLIRHHQQLYHEKDAPLISDEAYDSLIQELLDIEERFPELKKKGTPTERVGGDASRAFTKVTHTVRQWSFDNVFTGEELKEWEERLYRFLAKKGITKQKLTYVAEHKIDGLKVILEYKKGILARATTRGDGIVGEDITHTVRTINDVPAQLTKNLDIIVAGEAWLSEAEFTRINKDRKKKDEPLFANPRNAAAGSLRQLDARITKDRKLSFYAYDIDDMEGASNPGTQNEELKLLKNLGFTTNTHNHVCRTIDEALTYYRSWAPKKLTMPYGFDGVVLKVNDVALQTSLGHTAKSPRYGIAFKFPSEQATTIIEDIQLQVGRTGVITPVAHLRPVVIAGSTVSRATLHNEDQIKKLDVRVGDTVILQKAGDIIPEILNVLKELRPNKTKPFTFPKKIAECGGDGSIERILGDAAYRCVDRDSDKLHRERLYYFVSKKALNIDGLGPKIIDLLLENNLVNTYSDLFTLTEGDLIDLPSFKEKASENLISAIHEAREVPFYRLLVGLSIEHVGDETARIIAENKKTLKAIEEASLEELSEIFGVGEIVARSVHDWIHNKENQKTLKELLKHITVVSPSKKTAVGKLEGKTMVFTGTMRTLGRSEAEERARSEGAHTTSTVSAKTDYVVVGKNPGSKEAKARSLGVKVIDEDEFRQLVSK